MSEGCSGWTEIPTNCQNADAFYHPDRKAREALNTKSGYFLQHDIARLDARFFSCSSIEADIMHPQQRILIETIYDALENAGKGGESLDFINSIGFARQTGVSHDI